MCSELPSTVPPLLSWSTDRERTSGFSSEPRRPRMTALPSHRISLLLADVDGTLVTEQKVLTERAKAAVQALREKGIRFAVTSGRPPRGMAMLIEPLAIDTAIAGFNGGALVQAGSVGHRGKDRFPGCRAPGHRADRPARHGRVALYGQGLVRDEPQGAACRSRSLDREVRAAGRRARSRTRTSTGP